MLAAELGKLTDRLMIEAKRHAEEGKRVNSKVLVVKSVITQFNYNEGNISHTRSVEFIEKDEWHIVDQYEFLQKQVKEFEEYKLAVSQLEEQFHMDAKDADSKLTRYAQVVTSRYLDNEKEFNVLDAVTSFIQDLDETPIMWKVQGALTGIVLGDDEIKIGKYKLRIPCPADFEYEERIDAVALGYSHREMGMYGEMPTAFIEYTTRASSQNEVYMEYSKILDSLRLYKTGSISNLSFNPTPISIIRMAGRQFNNTRTNAPYKYKLNSAESPAVEKHIELNSKLLEDINGEDDEGNKSPLNVSLTRFRDALSVVGVLEARITSAITCLESLLLKAHERSELSHRLCQRASFLLSQFGLNSIQTYGLLQRAYDVRSTYIHGSEIEEEKRKELNSLTKESVEFARIVLCIFMQLSKKYEKDNLIKKIDNAILDSAACEKLMKTISESVEVLLTN